MKALPLKMAQDGNSHHQCEAHEATHVMLNMPGPIPTRIIPVILKGTRAGTGCWSWNGDTEKPTLKPSIATTGCRDITKDEADRILAGETLDLPKIKCHTWVNDGMVQFLGDCTHELAGQTLPLLEVEQ